MFLTLYAVSSPQRGQDASFPTPESTVCFNSEFDGDSLDWVPSGSRTPFPIARVSYQYLRSLVC